MNRDSMGRFTKAAPAPLPAATLDFRDRNQGTPAPAFKVGDRVERTAADKDKTVSQPGDLGRVEEVKKSGNVLVHWDKNETCACTEYWPPFDRIRKVEDAPAPWPSLHDQLAEVLGMPVSMTDAALLMKVRDALTYAKDRDAWGTSLARDLGESRENTRAVAGQLQHSLARIDTLLAEKEEWAARVFDADQEHQIIASIVQTRAAALPSLSPDELAGLEAQLWTLLERRLGVVAPVALGVTA